MGEEGWPIHKSIASARAGGKDAQAEGRSFMPYTAAKAHLRKTIIGVAAGDPASIMTRVLGDEAGIPDARQ
jgi:hypothetical protein